MVSSYALLATRGWEEARVAVRVVRPVSRNGRMHFFCLGVFAPEEHRQQGRGRLSLLSPVLERRGEGEGKRWRGGARPWD